MTEKFSLNVLEKACYQKKAGGQKTVGAEGGSASQRIQVPSEWECECLRFSPFMEQCDYNWGPRETHLYTESQNSLKQTSFSKLFIFLCMV